MVNARHCANLSRACQVFLNRFHVGLSQRAGFRMQFGFNFHASKQRVVLKRKLEFVVVHDVKHDDLVFPQTKLTERFCQISEIKKQIRKQNNHATLPNLRGESKKRIADVRFVVRSGLFKFVQDQLQVRWVRTRFQGFVDFVAEQYQSDGVLLLLHQVSKAGRRRRRIIELAPAGFFSVPHRTTAINKQMTVEVGFFFIFLDVQPVGFGPDFPIDMSQIVARRVFAVSRELDREAVVGTAMLSRDKTLHHQPRARPTV